MTRDDIYDHLAQVYLGKRSKAQSKQKRQFNAWLIINIVITVIILASAFYGLTAFLRQKSASLENSIIFSLHNGPTRIEFNFEEPYPSVKYFTLEVPPVDVSKYKKIRLSVRAKEEGTPGFLKVVLKNKKNETSYQYIQGIDFDWKEVVLPLEDFQEITDWRTLTEVAFALEAWNVENQKGIVLIGDVSFSN